MICQQCFINRSDASMRILSNRVERILRKNNKFSIEKNVFLEKNQLKFDCRGGRLTVCLVCRQTNRKILNEKRKIVLCLTYFFIHSRFNVALGYLQFIKTE